MAEPALKVVKDHEVEFVPERFTKTYVNWLENIRDWTISRQLWWGHRIPAWYCDDCGETIVSREDITECPHCHGHVTQDPDVLIHGLALACGHLLRWGGLTKLQSLNNGTQQVFS